MSNKEKEKIKLGHAPDWSIVKFDNGRRYGVVRLDSSIGNHVSVQFSDKTALMISTDILVEIVTSYQELVFEKLRKLEQETISYETNSFRLIVLLIDMATGFAIFIIVVLVILLSQ